MTMGDLPNEIVIKPTDLRWPVSGKGPKDRVIICKITKKKD